MPNPRSTQLLAASAVAVVLGAVLVASLGLGAALLGAGLVVAGALAGRFWVALLPLLPAATLAAFVLAQASPATGEVDWSGLIAFLAILAGAGAAFCLALGTAVARLAARVDLG